jgi:hypothetical protein
MAEFDDEPQSAVFDYGHGRQNICLSQQLLQPEMLISFFLSQCSCENPGGQPTTKYFFPCHSFPSSVSHSFHQ